MKAWRLALPFTICYMKSPQSLLATVGEILVTRGFLLASCLCHEVVLINHRQLNIKALATTIR